MEYSKITPIKLSTHIIIKAKYLRQILVLAEKAVESKGLTMEKY